MDERNISDIFGHEPDAPIRHCVFRLASSKYTKHGMMQVADEQGRHF